MGLDISVRCEVKSFKQSIKHSSQFKYIEYVARFLTGYKVSDKIKTAPGSYAGLHRLREEFTKHLNLPTTLHAKPFPVECEKYHLLNHSDCSGWYLPSEFDTPLWVDGTSIGSTHKLLEELEMIPPGSHEWISLYVPCVASIIEGEPIKFY